MAKLFDILKLFISNLEALPGLASVSGLGPAWLFGALGTVAISLYGLSLGRTRAVISLLAIYTAFTFDRTFPYLGKIQEITANQIEIYWLRAGIFFIAYVLIFTVFNFSFVRKKLSSAEFSLFSIVLISLLQLGFLVSIVLSFLPESLVIQLSLGPSVNYFADSRALFLWAVAPLLALLFLKSK